ncbi:MAG TPA: NUDIX hydrolase [Solirubrobacteraceae bacterium]|nr:NUDIX hydrolase [Solirubrobacteraceae bacterium]
MDPEAAEVKASGGVVWRRAPGGEVELVVVHRPRYDDWSLPKGKLHPGEAWEQAALREVEEEVGLRCRLGEELPAVAYRDNKGRAKAVRYWLMQPDEGSGEASAGGEAPGRDRKASGRGRSAASFTPNDEVDEMRWVDVAAAAALLSYPHDAELVRVVEGRV